MMVEGPLTGKGALQGAGARYGFPASPRLETYAYNLKSLM